MAERTDTTRLVVWIVVAFVAVGALMAVGMAAGGGLEWMTGWGWMMPMMALMWLPIILIIVLVHHLIARPGEGHMDGERLLDARYARGELSREEYMRMREDIRAGRNR